MFIVIKDNQSEEKERMQWQNFTQSEGEMSQIAFDQVMKKSYLFTL